MFLSRGYQQAGIIYEHPFFLSFKKLGRNGDVNPYPDAAIAGQAPAR